MDTKVDSTPDSPSDTSVVTGICYPTIYHTNITVKDVESPPTGTWKKYTLYVDIRKDFLVDVLIENETVYLKPTKPYYSAEFEKMFNFGINCNNYDKNKVVEVVFPKDYYKYFQN